MIENLAVLLNLSQISFWGFFTIFIRVAAITGLLPAFGEQSIPLRIRLAIAFAFTLVIEPAAASGPSTSINSLPAFATLCVTELLAGVFFGLLLRFFVIGLQVAGAIAAQSTSLSQIFGGSAGIDPQPAIGRILVTAGLALAGAMNLHVDFAIYMLEGYRLVPQGVILEASTVADVGLSVVSRIFALGFTLAAPFVIASLIYNVTLGFINRAMPQLMVSFIGAPAITAGGLILLAISAPFMLDVWMTALSGFALDPQGAVR